MRALFKVSRLGTIAGCMVTNGVVRRGASVRVVRDGTVIHETSIAQLKRFKEDAREVAEGFECGILLDGFNDVKEGDVLEVFETREVERTDLETPAASARRASLSPASEPCPARVGHREVEVPTGFVGILSFELFFPESHSLKEKRMHLRSVKQQLQNRIGCSIAEVDHHDVWQRSRLTLACVTREAGRRSGSSTRRSGGCRAGVRRRVRAARARPSRGRWGRMTRPERMRRVDEAVKQVLSEAIPTLKDPRIGFVTVTAVETSSDLDHAKVWLSVFGNERQRAKTLEALAGASGRAPGPHQPRAQAATDSRGSSSSTIARSSTASA